MSKARERWLARRRDSVGASEVAAVLGAHPWQSPLDVWLSKVRPDDADDVSDKMAVRMGNLLEPVVARLYAEATGRKVVNPGRYKMQRDEAAPMHATLDRMTYDERKGWGVLEIKTTGAHLGDLWTDEPPLWVQVQEQAQLACVPTYKGEPVRWASTAVLIGGQRFAWADMDRAPDFIAEVRVKVAGWWQRHVIDGEQPPAQGRMDLATVKRLYAGAQPGLSVDLPPDLVQVDEEYRSAKEAEREARKRAEAAEARLREVLGEAERGVLPNGVTYTLREIAVPERVMRATTYRRLYRKENER